MLTQVQTNAIISFCEDRGIKYYDVQLELIDHIAEWIENEQSVSQVSFEEAFAKMKRNFTTADFRNIVRSKERSVAGLLKRNLLHSFIAFFSWPKIAVTFLLVALIITFDRYAGAERFPQYGIYILNMLNLTIPFGNRMFLNEYRYTKVRPLVSAKEINRISFYFLLPGIIYTLFYFCYYQKILIAPVIYKISLYLFPLILLLSLAWKNASIAANNRIRGEYPRAFAIRKNK